MRGRWGAMPDFAVRSIRAPSFRGAARGEPGIHYRRLDSGFALTRAPE
jgi:hypothetical protein